MRALAGALAALVIPCTVIVPACGLFIAGPVFPSLDRLDAALAGLQVDPSQIEELVVEVHPGEPWRVRLNRQGEVVFEGDRPELELSAREWELLFAGTFVLPVTSARFTLTYVPGEEDRMLVTDDGGWVIEMRWEAGQRLPRAVRLAAADGTLGPPRARLERRSAGHFALHLDDGQRAWSGEISVRAR